MRLPFGAYLNHIGSQEIKFWEQMIPYREELSVLSKHLDFTFDRSLRVSMWIFEAAAPRMLLVSWSCGRGRLSVRWGYVRAQHPDLQIIALTNH